MDMGFVGINFVLLSVNEIMRRLCRRRNETMGFGGRSSAADSIHEALLMSSCTPQISNNKFQLP